LPLSLEDIDASASDIRKKLRNGHDVKRWVPASVLSIIQERGLYKKSSPVVKDYREFAKTCSEKALDKKALDLKLYDLVKLNSYTDYAIVCSATSGRHASSIAEGIINYVRDEIGLVPLSTEGLIEGQWVLIDFGPVVVHVFQDSVRSYYKMETLWSRCKQFQNELPLPKPAAQREAPAIITSPRP
jgi:nicotinate-nucleotide adenylyltransferase